MGTKVKHRESYDLDGISHAVPIPFGTRVGNMLFSSGIMGMDRMSGALPTDLETQVHHSFLNMRALLEKAGGTLDDVAHVIPADTTVCATLSGTWLDGIGPFGRDSHEAMALWTRQAHPPFLVLTSPHPYQRPDRFQESIDFVVCVQPPGGAERARNASNRMHLDVTRMSSAQCLNTPVQP